MSLPSAPSLRWKVAASRLQAHRRDAALYAAIWSIVMLLLLLVGSALQRLCLRFSFLSPATFLRFGNHWDGFLILCVVGGQCLTSPLRTQMEWWMAETVGVLDACDCGFLACSSRVWLWGRRTLLTLCAAGLQGIACLLPVVPAVAALVLFQMACTMTEAIVPLFFAANALLLCVWSLRVPLRVWCGLAALPLCFLKQPNWSAPRLLLQALRCTRGASLRILWGRLSCLPLLLFPFTTLYALPTLVAAELLLSAQLLTESQSATKL